MPTVNDLFGYFLSFTDSLFSCYESILTLAFNSVFIQLKDTSQKGIPLAMLILLVDFFVVIGGIIAFRLSPVNDLGQYEEDFD